MTPIRFLPNEPPYYLLCPERLSDLRKFAATIGTAIAAAEKEYGFQLIWHHLMEIESDGRDILPDEYNACGFLACTESSEIVLEEGALLEEDIPKGQPR